MNKALKRKYAQFLSELPCFLCGIIGASQGAHIHLEGQKSKGKKVSWKQMIPLCHEGANGCHVKVDQYKIKIDRSKVVGRAIIAANFWEAGQHQDAKYILAGME
jgi:hypothetical protein